MTSALHLAAYCALSLSAAAACASEDEDIPSAIGQMAMLPSRSLAAGEPLSDHELQQRSARIGRIGRIGRIVVTIEDVFEDSLSLSAPYRVVNSLHIATHIETIRQQLLFREGDAFNRRVLDETARLLRDQRYLADASIEPLRYNQDNTVDVLVRVHDVWTMSPGLSFGRKGGENSMEFEFEDTNFLGLGKTVSASRSKNVDRSA